MVGELASSIPAEGGFYVWVRRALGPFWGFQEAWLSLAASVFDMAIYPTIFVLYLGRLAPAWTAGYRGTFWALAVVVGCTLWNLTGAKAVGQSSVVLFCVLLAPFVILITAGLWAWHGHGTGALLQSRRGPRSRRRHRRHHVELHGLGQRQHRRAGGGRPAAQLSARHARRHCAGGLHLHPPAAGRGPRRPRARPILHRCVDGRRAHPRRSAARYHRRCRRHDQWRRHVQPAHDEHYPRALRDGGRRPGSAGPAAPHQARRPVGQRAGVRGDLGSRATLLPSSASSPSTSSSTARR